MHRSLQKAAILIALVSVGSIAAQAADTVTKRTVSVTGTGIVNAKPDTASISVGVVSNAKTARDALNKNTAAMTRVIGELKGQGIEPKDIQTSNFSVNPRYQHFKDGKPAAVVGYTVTNSATIVVRNLKNLGAILDLTVSRGSNRINGIRFSVDDVDELENKARRRAMKNARQKANLYATAGNAEIGQILTISEDAISRPPQPVFRRAALEASSAPVPIEAGEQQITARVQVSWELKD